MDSEFVGFDVVPLLFGKIIWLLFCDEWAFVLVFWYKLLISFRISWKSSIFSNGLLGIDVTSFWGKIDWNFSNGFEGDTNINDCISATLNN
jgi:hypothetical protein